MTDWHGKPYYSLDAYCKNMYHHKLYKIALNARLTCPNRDGRLGTRGCIFCSAGGSGEFAAPLQSDDITDIRSQLEAGKASFGQKNTGSHYIAYFQAYTNTYGPIPYLERIFHAALAEPDIFGISIATRPDCLGDNVLQMLCRLQKAFPEKFIWMELGLQTIHERTADYIRRGYPLSVFEESFRNLSSLGFPVIVHTILGLPGESAADQFETADYLGRLRPFGVKLQLLHVLQNTDLAEEYLEGKFSVLTKEAYLDILIECISRLSTDTVIHRVTGDGRGKDLIAPDWSRNKKDVLNSLHHKMKLLQIRQGDHLQS